MRYEPDQKPGRAFIPRDEFRGAVVDADTANIDPHHQQPQRYIPWSQQGQQQQQGGHRILPALTPEAE